VVEAEFIDELLVVENAEKRVSLTLQIREHYQNVWRFLFLQEIKKENVPDSFPSCSLSSFTWNMSMEYAFNNFVPPLPIKRIEGEYTVDYLDSVIFPLLVAQFPSYFELLKQDILEQVMKYAILWLRSGILSVCKRTTFSDLLIATDETLVGRNRQWLALGANSLTIGSASIQSVQKIVVAIPIYKNPPFPIDKSSSYSEEALNVVIPALIREILDEEKAIVAILLNIDVMARKEALDRLCARCKWNCFVFEERVPLYSEIVDGLKLYDPTARELALMAKQITKGSSFLI
jgi:hypothetical protein